MKVYDPNLSTLGSVGTSKAQETAQTGKSSRAPDNVGSAARTDDIHLSELVRSLRSLAADSPERQARIEQIARDYASGNYKVDAQATAGKIIDDAFNG